MLNNYNVCYIQRDFNDTTAFSLNYEEQLQD